MARITIGGKSDMGCRRTNNEDAYIAQPIWDKRNYLLAVAIDGVGGYEGGEVAAQMAQEGIVEYLEQHTEGDHQTLLRDAVIYVNNKIYEERQRDPERSNMSCVLSAALFDKKNSQVHMAHVGDTRFYRYSNRQLEKLSHDHSLVGYREEIGELTEEEAMHHPQRNVISRSVGSEFMRPNTDLVEVDTTLIPRTNCTYLLCSDGLTDLVTSAQIISVLESGKTLKAQMQMLIDAANAAGGKDNITVVLVNISVNESSEAVEDDDLTPPPHNMDNGENVTVTKISENNPKGKQRTSTTTTTTTTATTSSTVSKNKLAIPFGIVVVALLACMAGGTYSFVHMNKAIEDGKILNQQLDSATMAKDSLQQMIVDVDTFVHRQSITPEERIKLIKEEVFHELPIPEETPTTPPKNPNNPNTPNTPDRNAATQTGEPNTNAH